MHVVSWIVLVAWAGTLLTTVLNLILLPRLRRGAPDHGPRVSVIIPARDEERAITQSVRAFLAQAYRNLEIIVVNDRSTDRTAAILHTFETPAAEGQRPSLRVVNGVEPPPGWLGKPWAMHQGSAVASGDIFLFADADIVYEPWAISAAVDRLTKSNAAMIALFPRFLMETFGERLILPMLAITALSFAPTWLANRTRAVLFALGGGTGNMVRRDAYFAAGGHDALKASVVDDVALARLVRRAGQRTELAIADDCVSVRMYHGMRETLDGFTKNIFAVYGRSYLLVAIFSILSVVFHVLPYALAIAGDRVNLATVAVLTLTRLLLFGFLGYSLLHALLAHPFTVLSWTWMTLRSAWTTGVKRQLTWRGRTYDAAATRFGADR